MHTVIGICVKTKQSENCCTLLIKKTSYEYTTSSSCPNSVLAQSVRICKEIFGKNSKALHYSNFTTRQSYFSLCNFTSNSLKKYDFQKFIKCQFQLRSRKIRFASSKTDHMRLDVRDLYLFLWEGKSSLTTLSLIKHVLTTFFMLLLFFSTSLFLCSFHDKVFQHEESPLEKIKIQINMSWYGAAEITGVFKYVLLT